MAKVIMSDNLHELVSQLIVDTKGSADGSFWSVTADSSLCAFRPELIICATIVLMLFIRVFPRVTVEPAWYLKPFLRGGHWDMSYVALLGSLAALYFAAPWMHLGAAAASSSPLDPGAVTRMEIFTGMLVYDTFGVYVRALLLFFAVLFVVLTKLSGIPDCEDGPDIYTLMLGATLGMCLMATANHLLMVFMAVEMASVPSYVLAGMLKGRRLGSEAALKYSVYGAGAAGVMLYGISLIAGLLNTAHLPTIAVRLAEQYSAMEGSQLMVLALAALMIMVGLAFKLSAVPFHFWCPDVFEGATAEVDAFLSVASKAAALALLVRVAVGFGVIPPDGPKPGQRTLANAQLAEAENAADESIASGGSPGVVLVVHRQDISAIDESQPAEKSAAIERLAPVRSFIGKLVALLAVVTCTFGNLAAYGQTNIKRLMAYSTIAHAGYMMMPVPVIMVLAQHDPAIARSALAALCIYMFVYLFMNLGAFAIIAFLRNAMRSEEIVDYSGLVRRFPDIVIWFAILLFGLIGLPPLAGFIGKFAIFASLADGYRVSSAAGQPATYLLLLLVIGGINTAISLFYYLRVVKTMTLDPEPEDRPPFELASVSQRVYVAFTAIVTVVLFLEWNWVSQWAQSAARYVL